MAWGGLQFDAFVFMAVFCRVGSALMTMPAFGEVAIPSRVKLILALLVSVGMIPVVGGSYPAMPEDLAPLTGLIFGEIAIGLAMGMLIRMFMMAVQVAGTLIATTGGLAFAQNFDPTIGIQGALVSSLMSMLTLVLIFQTDLHHLLLLGVRNSYTLFPVGAAIDWASFADLSVRTFADAFRLGFQLSTPFIAFSLIFYTALGAVAKLMPQLQIFFLAMPINILIGFVILMLTISSILYIFLGRLEDFLLTFLG